MARRFILGLGDVALGVEDIWPDGDAPPDPTVEDVVARMQSTGCSAARLAAHWNLLDEIEVSAGDGSRAVFR